MPIIGLVLSICTTYYSHLSASLSHSLILRLSDPPMEAQHALFSLLLQLFIFSPKHPVLEKCISAAHPFVAIDPEEKCYQPYELTHLLPVHAIGLGGALIHLHFCYDVSVLLDLN